MNAVLEKRQLLEHWLVEHTGNNAFLLFSSGHPTFDLSAEAVGYFEKPESKGEYVYVLCHQTSDRAYIPLYIGKTGSPRKRWLQGHLPRLRAATAESSRGSYTRWIKALKEKEDTIYLICLHETEIRTPPIPGFPKTVGSLEYQLISLANDAYPGQLLNYEGVAR